MVYFIELFRNGKIFVILGQIPEVEDAHNESNSSNFESTIIKKRKASENAAERRFKEKMKRQDRYLDLVERITKAIEKTVPNEEN